AHPRWPRRCGLRLPPFRLQGGAAFQPLAFHSQHDSQSYPQFALQRDSLGFGVLLQSLPRPRDQIHPEQLEQLRFLPGGNRRSPQAQTQTLRDADLVLWPRFFGRQENHLARRFRGHLGLDQISIHGLTEWKTRGQRDRETGGWGDRETERQGNKKGKTFFPLFHRPPVSPSPRPPVSSSPSPSSSSHSSTSTRFYSAKSF